MKLFPTAQYTNHSIDLSVCVYHQNSSQPMQPAYRSGNHVLKKICLQSKLIQRLSVYWLKYMFARIPPPPVLTYGYIGPMWFWLVQGLDTVAPHHTHSLNLRTSCWIGIPYRLLLIAPVGRPGQGWVSVSSSLVLRPGCMVWVRDNTSGWSDRRTCWQVLALDGILCNAVQQQGIQRYSQSITVPALATSMLCCSQEVDLSLLHLPYTVIV